jgi:hypothetical protein
VDAHGDVASLNQFSRLARVVQGPIAGILVNPDPLILPIVDPRIASTTQRHRF